MTQNPTAFISYSWDTEAHKEWVRQLAARLRSDGVDVALDRDNLALGDELTAYMEQKIATSDYVLFVCTPNYKSKSDGRKGGVGYEGAIISAEIFRKGNHRKFIPILASGTWDTSSPIWAGSKLGADLSVPSNFEEGYENIVGTILRRRTKSVGA